MALLQPVGRRPGFMARDAFVQRLLTHRADARLRTDLRELAPDTTEDLPSP